MISSDRLAAVASVIYRPEVSADEWWENNVDHGANSRNSHSGSTTETTTSSRAIAENIKSRESG